MSVVEQFGQTRQCDRCGFTVTGSFSALKGWVFVTEMGEERAVSVDFCPRCTEEVGFDREIAAAKRRRHE